MKMTVSVFENGKDTGKTVEREMTVSIENGLKLVKIVAKVGAPLSTFDSLMALLENSTAKDLRELNKVIKLIAVDKKLKEKDNENSDNSK